MPSCAFELDRFTADDERLEISGRWLGVRGRRFVRPSLTAFVDGHSTRALAELEHKPWAAEDGDDWVAAFRWSGELDEIEEFELAVAPDLSVRLPRPDEAISEAVLPVVAPKDEARPGPVERTPEPPRGDPQEQLEQADAVRHNALAVRDQALADLDSAIAMRDGLRAELDQALADRDRLREELAQAATDHEQVRTELKRAASDRGRLSAEFDHVAGERDRLRAECEQLRSKGHTLEAELGRVRAQLRMVQSDLVLARKPSLDEPPLPATTTTATASAESPDPLPAAAPRFASSGPSSIGRPGPPGMRQVLPLAPTAQLRRTGPWSVRALTIALMIAALALFLVIVLTSGPASVAP